MITFQHFLILLNTFKENFINKNMEALPTLLNEILNDVTTSNRCIGVSVQSKKVNNKSTSSKFRLEFNKLLEHLRENVSLFSNILLYLFLKMNFYLLYFRNVFSFDVSNQTSKNLMMNLKIL